MGAEVNSIEGHDGASIFSDVRSGVGDSQLVLRLVWVRSNFLILPGRSLREIPNSNIHYPEKLYQSNQRFARERLERAQR